MLQGVQQHFVRSPNLLTIICFIQHKTKPFLLPGNRYIRVRSGESFSTLVADGLQSSSEVLTSALTAARAKHTSVHGFSSDLFIFVHFWTPGSMHFTSGHFTVQVHFPVSGDKGFQSCLAQSSSYNKAAVRKSWLLRKATLGLPLSAHHGAGLQ